MNTTRILVICLFALALVGSTAPVAPALVTKYSDGSATDGQCVDIGLPYILQFLQCDHEAAASSASSQ